MSDNKKAFLVLALFIVAGCVESALTGWGM
jgi:hypothetical protein